MDLTISPSKSMASGAIRTVTGNDGSYSVELPPNSLGTVHLYDPVSHLVKHASFFTAPDGGTTDIFHQTESDWVAYNDLVGPCEFSGDTEDDFCYPDSFTGSALWDISRSPDSDKDGINDDIEFILGGCRSHPPPTSRQLLIKVPWP